MSSPEENLYSPVRIVNVISAFAGFLVSCISIKSASVLPGALGIGSNIHNEGKFETVTQLPFGFDGNVVWKE